MDDLTEDCWAIVIGPDVPFRKEIKVGKMERFWMWLAWRLPRPLVRWALVRATVNATTGKYAAEATPEVTAVTVAQRWDNQPYAASGYFEGGWNPWNKVVHRTDGMVDPMRTNVERALRGLPVPWHPDMADAEVGAGVLPIDKIEMELAQRDPEGFRHEPATAAAVGASMQLGIPRGTLVHKKP